MKKTASLIVVLTMCITMCYMPAKAQENFFDLTDRHWAYTDITTLVSRGTVNGYPDNTFRPENSVTRAEFAKMFGAGKETKSTDFADLPKSHWSYSYVMASGVDRKSNYFRPDEYILRSEVLEALWDRYGTKVDAQIPGIISSQSSNKDMLAWAYTTKLMTGNDGVDLRLSDTITRAEVSALILRCEKIDINQKASFEENISDNLVKKIYNTLSLFGKTPYSKDAKLTYGQVANASMILAYGNDEYAPSAQYKINYNGKYQVAMSALCAYVWDESKNTLEYENKNITVQDALLALMNAVVTSSQKDIPVGGDIKSYKDSAKTGSLMAKVYETYAFNKGIFFTSDASLKASDEITMKQFMCLLIQADNCVGFVNDYRDSVRVNNKILRSSDLYPVKYTDFSVIEDGVPAKVYDEPWNYRAKDFYYKANSYGSVIRNFFDDFSRQANSTGLFNMTYTYYPSMVVMDGNCIKFRVKLNFENVKKGTTLSKAFKAADTDALIENSKNYWVEFSTERPLSDYIEPDRYRLLKIISVE